MAEGVVRGTAQVTEYFGR